MASGQLITPQKNYDDVGVFYRTPLIYNFNVGYNLNNWNFELGTRNPFSTFVKKSILRISIAHIPGIMVRKKRSCILCECELSVQLG